jgi:hypothetical protein
LLKHGVLRFEIMPLVLCFGELTLIPKPRPFKTIRTLTLL